MNATKVNIRRAYIAALQAAYPFYTEGSRPLMLAHGAVDKALAGKMRLEGDCWAGALKACGLPKDTPLKALAALPEGGAA